MEENKPEQPEAPKKIDETLLEPSLTGLTIDDWHKSDELLRNLVEFVDKKALNENDWDFFLPTQEKITYKELAKKLQDKYPPFDLIQAMRVFFLDLPARLERIRKDILIIFHRHTFALTERANYCQALREAFDQNKLKVNQLAFSLDQLRKREADMEKERHLVEIQKEKLEYEAKIQALNEIINDKLGEKEKLESNGITKPEKKDILEPKRQY